MDLYPYDHINVNGRAIMIRDILDQRAVGASPFESALFSFVKQWLDGEKAFQLHTSGSTGAPKTVTITRELMQASANLSRQVLGLQRAHNALVCLDPRYIAGKMMLVRSFETGMHIDFVDPVSNPLVHIKETRLNFCAMVPLQAHDVVRSPYAQRLTSDTTLIIGGGAIDEQTIRLLQDIPCHCYATYGMTETVSHVALRKLNGKGASQYFTTLPGITVSVDQRGCLVVRWKALPQDVITNDVAELVDEHSFRWTGRWDNVINSGGYKVIPEAVERVLSKVFTVLQVSNRFFIGSKADAKLENKVVLYVEGHIPQQTLSEITEKLRQIVNAYEMPKETLFKPSFVETTNGKINRIATMNLTSGSDHLTP